MFEERLEQMQQRLNLQDQDITTKDQEIAQLKKEHFEENEKKDAKYT